MSVRSKDDARISARTDFRNGGELFGIKREDRFSHVYVIGKTGTGKSTLLERMALQDLERETALRSSIRTAIWSSGSPTASHLNGYWTFSTWMPPIRRSRTDTIRCVMSATIGLRWPRPA